MIDKSYIKPPVTEAVIGINFVSTVDPDNLKSLSNKLGKFYRNIQVLSDLKLSVSINDNDINNLGTKASSNQFFRLSSIDQSQIAVLTGNSFLLSQLAPYKGWDDFFERFKRDWSTIKNSIGFQEISRIGVRYINRIDLPIIDNKVEHEHYLTIFPSLPPKLSSVHAYAMQTGFELNDIGCALLINSGVVESPILNHVSYILDFDIFKETTVPQKDSDIFDLLNSIRAEKNRIFEECITNKARELFNPDVK